MKGEKQDKRAGAETRTTNPTAPRRPSRRARRRRTSRCTRRRTRLLSTDFRGRPVILMFYPADWSPVCGDQVVLYNELLPEVQRHDEGGLARHLGGRRLVSPRFRPRSQIEIPPDGGL